MLKSTSGCILQNNKQIGNETIANDQWTIIVKGIHTHYTGIGTGSTVKGTCTHSDSKEKGKQVTWCFMPSQLVRTLHKEKELRSLLKALALDLLHRTGADNSAVPPQLKYLSLYQNAEKYMQQLLQPQEIKQSK